MAGESFERHGLWDEMSPEDAASQLVERFAAGAVAEGIRLALDARAAGDDEAYRFWTAAYARVFADGFRRGAAGGQ